MVLRVRLSQTELLGLPFFRPHDRLTRWRLDWGDETGTGSLLDGV